jgi:biopolymer transport protein ExbD
MRRYQTPLSDEESLEEPLVNLTPLIDVVFVVLIAFMLIAPILNIDSIQLSSGEASSKKELPSITTHPLSISIRSDNSIWFQGKKTTLKELQTELIGEKKRRPKEIPQLIPDARAHFETYNQVKNVIETCGFQQMDIILKAS